MSDRMRRFTSCEEMSCKKHTIQGATLCIKPSTLAKGCMRSAEAIEPQRRAQLLVRFGAAHQDTHAIFASFDKLLLHVSERPVDRLHHPEVIDDGEILRAHLLPMHMSFVVHLEATVAVGGAADREEEPNQHDAHNTSTGKKQTDSQIPPHCRPRCVRPEAVQVLAVACSASDDVYRCRRRRVERQSGGVVALRKALIDGVEALIGMLNKKELSRNGI